MPSKTLVSLAVLLAILVTISAAGEKNYELEIPELKKLLNSKVVRAEVIVHLKTGGEGEKSNQDTIKELQEFLAKKYDWVSWSVHLINHSGSSYRNWRAGDNFHQVNNINVVVSYSCSPQPVPKDCIRQLMEGPVRKGDAQAVVEALEKQLPGFVAHAVSRHKESYAACSFPEDCHYWERHKNVALCVHSE
ncbi:hypothetical protein AAFF_G00426540 [Aldrovandia affinis]|uniref:Uncharacterized protein n=1 Tax=Aldrovandia affinis TaxID=143900 RepID=A0AAD7WJK7_9TELE|nr:hypothetical protein AAFF_G00426540 [Aldrovandia affinis]